MALVKMWRLTHKHIALTLLLCLLGSQAHAQESQNALDDLVRSPAFDEFQTQSSKLKRKTSRDKKWLPTDSEYSSLFGSQRAVMQLIEWVAPYVQGYTKFEVDAEKTPEYVRASAKYAARDDQDLFNVVILVPHPRNIRSASLNLLESFKKAREVPAELASSQTYKVRGLDAIVHRDKADQCSLVMELKRGALINITTKQCKEEKRLLDFARSLDITRLNRKLDS